MLRVARRTLRWARGGLASVGVRRGPPVGPHRSWWGAVGWRLAKSLCVGVVAAPVGVTLISRCFPTVLAEAPPPVVVSELVVQADQLYDSNKMREGLELLLQYEHLEEVEILWRLARFCFKTGKYHCQDPAESRRLAEKGWRFIERALAGGGKNHNSCQRWAGILLSWSSEFEGYKKKIEKSFEIKEHFLAAIECDPSDATSKHLLGQWCYSVVSVPWYQRQVASVLFATPPSSSYEEALSHFEAAEKVDPGFYMVNWLWLGKCHVALGNKAVARQWLEKVIEFKTSLEEEIEAQQEAQVLLSKL